MKSVYRAGAFLVLAAICAFGSPQAAAETGVGQIDIQRVYNEYHGMMEFEADMHEIQREFQEAQEAGDQARLMELQQEFQARQEEFHREFEASLIEATEKITEETNLEIVVAEVIYHKPGAEIVDVSEELIEAMNEGAPEHEEEAAPVPMP